MSVFAVALRVVVAIALVTSGGVSIGAQGTSNPVPEPGTYRIWLCAAPCTPADASRAVGVATLVILDDAAAAAEPVRSVFATLPAVTQSRESTGIDNTCFKVTQRDRMVGSDELLFGLMPRGTSRWTYTAADGFSLRVFSSPDASYTLRWNAAGTLTNGEGWTSLPDIRTRYHRDAYFAATRLGAADPAQCR